jgi:4-hydroxymandelate oxidase
MPPPLHEFEAAARAAMTDQAWRYVHSGAADELSVGEAVAAWRRRRLVPRVCRDVSTIDTAIDLLGLRLPHPVLVAPTGCHRLVHPDGEPASAAGAGRAGAVYALSMYTTSTVAEVAAAATGPWWLQLNVPPDLPFVVDLLAEAGEAGASGVVFTVDTPVPGLRERQRWDGVTLPDPLRFGILGRGPFAVQPAGPPTDIYRPALDASLTWDRLAQLCGLTALPVLVKGLLHPADADRAVAAGADAVIVSNHGGRNLDTVIATADALQPVVAAVAGRVPVLIDGGLRRGTDVLGALAAGATAVLVGRPVLWGLATGGAGGVQAVIERLVYELRMAMALCGARSVPELAELDLLRS